MTYDKMHQYLDEQCLDEKPALEERSTTCYHCGELVPPEQVIEYRGKKICPTCYDELWFGSSVKYLKFNL